MLLQLLRGAPGANRSAQVHFHTHLSAAGRDGAGGSCREEATDAEALTCFSLTQSPSFLVNCHLEKKTGVYNFIPVFVYFSICWDQTLTKSHS